MGGEYFVEDYPASRLRFRKSLERVQGRWGGARLASLNLQSSEDADLTIDWITAEPLGEAQRVLIITTGEHGIEGYVGSAMLECFLSEFLERLDPRETGLLLVHSINPWGMKHWRRVNANHVDLNRNFIWLDGTARLPASNLFDPDFNPTYLQLNSYLNPIGPAGSRVSDLNFFLRTLGNFLRYGSGGMRNTILMGQYHTPRGVYYGGSELQVETRQLMALFRREVARYPQIVLLDMHSGYGPRYQMSLVNSALEAGKSVDFAARLNYPRVVKATPDEFYPIQGDMVDAIYRLVQAEYPEKRIFATAFEFGTLGDSIAAALRSLWITINENRLQQYGAVSSAAKARIRNAFREMFYPGEEAWREKALEDARGAFAGILGAEGYFYEEQGRSGWQ